MSLYLGTTPIANDGSHRQTGEIGDIGFAPLGIDESLNLRRYLNGQVISQTQFEAFTTKVKSAIALFPNLGTTETNWQSEKSLSKLGQCGKFVIDDTAGTIRLPCVVNAQGLTDLQYLGTIKSESLPNIEGSATAWNDSDSQRTDFGIICGKVTGAFTRRTGYRNGAVPPTTSTADNEASCTMLGFDASLSSSTYQDNAPVQQEAIQYPYYIQVATGVEETLPAIREYKVNNSDFFGKSMYSDVAPDNASWLVSNGQWNAKSVYPDYYDWILENVNKGTENFKLSAGNTIYQFKGNTTETEAYTPSFTTRNPIVGSVCYGGSPLGPIGEIVGINPDGSLHCYRRDYNDYVDLVFKQELLSGDWWILDYDWVVNTSDETFRLPLLNGSEDLPSDRYEALTLASTTQRFTAPANGIYTVSSVGFGWVDITNETSGEFGSCSQPRTADGYGRYTLEAKRGDQIVIFCGEIPSSYICRFIYDKGNGSLYYYVGDTVQDASLINAGAVLGQLATKTNFVEAAAASMPSNRYINLTLGASGSTYTAPANGWFRLVKKANGVGQIIQFNPSDLYKGWGESDAWMYQAASVTDQTLTITLPVLKGQKFWCYYNAGGETIVFDFIYAEGESNV